MKILILGSGGMLGHELVEVFREKHDLTLWDRGEIDIADKEDVNEKISKLNPDVVINAAAYTAVDGAESDNETAYKVNGYAVGYLANICKELNSLFVHFSTDYVFDGRKKEGYSENDIPNEPLNEYGKSKLLGEKMISDIGPRCYLVRTSWLFGKSGKNFIETMLKIAAEGKDLKVVNDQVGSPTYAKDLAVRVKELIETKAPYGTYHVTNGGTCSWHEFAVKIFELCDMHPKIDPVGTGQFPAPAKRPRYSVLLNTKLPKMRPWQEALKDYLVETGRIKE